MGAKKQMQKLDTRVKSKNLHGGEETNHGELEPATKLEIKSQNQGCRESINGEEAKETKNKSRHLANEVIENIRNLSMSMEEEDVRDTNGLVLWFQEFQSTYQPRNLPKQI
ncbi:hypothetical protein AAZV13_15G172200 [Glycine max]